MSKSYKSDCSKPTFLRRFVSGPRAQRIINKSQHLMGGVADKHCQGLSVTKINAHDTFNQMGKFFSVSEAKSAFSYTNSVAQEIIEELVASRIRLMSTTIRTCFESQTRSLFNRNNFSIENSPDDETEEQD